MKYRFLQFAAVTLTSLVMAVPAVAYDHGLAADYVQMFATVQGPTVGKELHLIKPDRFVNDVRAGKQFVTVDIRTPGETRFFTGNLPGHLVIPLSQLFEQDQLARLPDDKPIVIICKSGTRATAATTALRRIGFTEAYVLQGGFKGLSAYLGPKEANEPLGPKTAGR